LVEALFAPFSTQAEVLEETEKLSRASCLLADLSRLLLLLLHANGKVLLGEVRIVTIVFLTREFDLGSARLSVLNHDQVE